MAGYLKPHTCEMCGAAFIGGGKAKYCLECRKRRDREIQRLCREKRRERESGNEPEGAEPKPAAKKKAPNTRQCRGCSYWRRITSNAGETYCCHYMLDTGHCRERDGDRCLSRTTKAAKPNISPWPVYQTGDSVYAGYGKRK